MAGFKAEEVLDSLDWDFSPYGGSGLIPEPSDLQIKNFQAALKGIFGPALVEQAKLKEQGIPTSEQIQEQLNAADDGSEQIKELIRAVAAVCSDQPNVAELTKLPYRLKRHFAGWVVGTFLNPEAGTPATNP
jgi:hypothetical protein